VGVFLVKPNYRELSSLLGRPIENDYDLEDVAQSMIKAGQSEAVLVSLGAAGAALITADDCKRFRAPVVPIQSKVGAGDSMVGGLVLALARGESLIEAARFGVAAGTAAVMTPGSELCRREDAERLYSQMVARADAA
jgi:6-phosphofructokinase 2